MKRDNRGRFVRKPTYKDNWVPDLCVEHETKIHQDWHTLPQMLVAGAFALVIGLLVARCSVYGLPSAISMPARLSQDPGSRTP